MTVAVDPVEVEQRLRRHVERVGGMAGFSFRRLSGSVEFWPASRVVGMAAVEDLDSARRCEVVAVDAAERFGFGVVFGWVAIEGVDPVAHYWNVRGSEIIDAANRRRRALGYCGKRLTDSELAVVSRFAGLSAVG